VELAHLVHEGLQEGAGLFLAVVGQVEEGEVAVVLPEALEQGIDHGAGIQVKGIMFVSPAAPLFTKSRDLPMLRTKLMLTEPTSMPRSNFPGISGIP
jgi:hypothetical protein